MSTHREKAENLFSDGYNCCQAVVAAFCDETGLDYESSLKVGLPFGGGVANARGICGAVSGMFMVLGLKCGFSEPDKDKKIKHYELLNGAKERFLKQMESTNCSDILKGRGKEGCNKSVGLAADIIEDIIRNKKY